MSILDFVLEGAASALNLSTGKMKVLARGSLLSVVEVRAEENTAVVKDAKSGVFYLISQDVPARLPA